MKIEKIEGMDCGAPELDRAGYVIVRIWRGGTYLDYFVKKSKCE